MGARWERNTPVVGEDGGPLWWVAATLEGVGGGGRRRWERERPRRRR